MKKLVRLAVVICLVVVLLEGAEWGMDRLFHANRMGDCDRTAQLSPSGKAFAAFADTYGFDVFHTRVNIEELPAKGGIYYLPLQLPVIDLRRVEGKNQLVAVQAESDAAVLVVFEPGKSHAVQTHTFLMPEIAEYINREGLWDKIFGRARSPYFRTW